MSRFAERPDGMVIPADTCGPVVVGLHPDGSITLTPPVAEYLRDLVLRSGGPARQEYAKLMEFVRFLTKQQGIGFEVWT